MDSTNPIRTAERSLRPLAAAFAALIAATPMAACTGLNGSVYDEPDAVATNLSGAFWDDAAYNDPCVIKAGSAYRMYLSRDADDLYTDGRAEPVGTFYATSADGLSWSLQPGELLALGSAADWDYNKVETPSVVYFKDEYHLYYSGGSEHATPVSYKIGHATSPDGLAWTKDPSNPVLGPASITGASGDVLHVAEPGALVVGDELWLYFTVTSARTVPGEPSSRMELYRSVSTDGSSFGAPVKVLSQGEHYPASFGFAGYSTPSAILNGGAVELYYDVYLQTNGAIAKLEQVALHRAVSDDGLAFSEDASPLIRASSHDWTAREIRGGSELIEDGTMKMWFSGDNYSTSGGAWSGKMTIGYASWPLD